MAYIYPNTASPLGDVPAVGGIAVDISSTDFTPPSGSFRRLYVGGAGNIVIKGLDGNLFTLTAVPIGTQLNVSGLAVMKTSTTATLMVALL
jgi:hypothetical protein